MLGAILGSIAGSAVTGLFNSREASKNRDFQEEMSNTSHQREVQDLIAAGLNPMLSAKLGGASSPGGSTATMPDLGATLNNAVGTSASSAKAREEINLVRQQTATAKSQQQLNEASAAKAIADAAVSNTSAASAAFDLEKKKYQQDNYHSWDVESRILLDNADIKSIEKLKEDNDWKSITYLNHVAEEMGYNTWEQAVKHRSFKNDLTSYIRNDLQVNKERAVSEFYNTEFGREIAPYMSSAQGGLDIASGAVDLTRRLGRGARNFSKGIPFLGR